MNIMSSLKIATWNAEWMAYMFSGSQNNFLKKNSKEKIPDVDAWAKRKADYIKSINPDILGIQEGPKTEDQMNSFVQKYLSDSEGNPFYDVYRNADGPVPKSIYDRQYLYLLVKRKHNFQVKNLKNNPKVKEILYEYWPVYYWGSVKEKRHRFWRRPLVTEINIEGKKLKIIIVHTKSLLLKRSKKWAKEHPQEFTKEAMKSRIKLATEAWKIRQYMDYCFEKQSDVPIILMGDLNDGPGRRYFEKHFFFQDMIDVIIGTLMSPEKFMKHAFADYDERERYTSEFSDWLNPNISDKLLLDHILLSPSFFDSDSELVLEKNSAIIDHQKYDDHFDDDEKKDRPSDHRVASVHIRY